MNKILVFFFALLLFGSLISSCVSPKEVLYFQTIQNDTIVGREYSYEPVLEADDLLAINVSAADYETVMPFNLPVVSQNLLDGRATGIPVQQNYLVQKNGTIDFPVLGNIKIAGLTRQQAKEYLIEKLKIYVEDPIINLKIMNFKITILGDVQRPGTFSINNERITILEALGMAGDLNITGRRDNILVIREIDGENAYTRIDITTDEIFNNPVYYLKQNDVIYVEPNKNRMNTSAYSPWIGVVLSSVSILATIIGYIIR
jgi:polysaccharide export outer membrane protein